MKKESGIQVNFSDTYDNYWSAFKYITKSDPNIFLSSNHPNMQEMSSPKTKLCVQAIRQKRKSRSTDTSGDQLSTTTKPPKIARLSNLEVSEFITRNKISNKDELFAIAHAQKEDGKKDLANFLLSRSQKSLSDLFASTKRLEAASEPIQRASMSRMDLIEKAYQKDDCVCQVQWLTCANQVLVSNDVHPYVLADRVRTLLSKGRGKRRNVIIFGPANCGKTFLLRPLEIIFKTFSNPANDKYGWVGADKAEVIFLNDFRWSRNGMSFCCYWKDTLSTFQLQKITLQGHTSFCY